MDEWRPRLTPPWRGRKERREDVEAWIFYGGKARLAPQLISFPEGRRRQRATPADAAAVRESAYQRWNERMNGVCK